MKRLWRLFEKLGTLELKWVLAKTKKLKFLLKLSLLICSKKVLIFFTCWLEQAKLQLNNNSNRTVLKAKILLKLQLAPLEFLLIFLAQLI